MSMFISRERLSPGRRNLARICMGLVIGVGLTAAEAGSVPTYTYEWNRGVDSMVGVNDGGGAVKRVFAQFSPTTNVLEYEVTMGPSPTATASGTVNKRPEGYTVVFSNGAVDFGTVMSQSGTVAQFYFDGSNAAAPKVTAYAWNGRPPVGIGFRPEDSWQDGSDNFPGVNPPDKLITSLLGTTFSAVSVVDTVGTLAGFGGTVPLRTFRFKADITNVIDHTPLYPASGEPWTGAEFGSTVGIWMHNYVCVRKDGIGDACQGMASTPGPTYGADGYLTSWDSSGPGGTYGTDGVLRYAGFFDRADQPTTFVPEPSTALLVAFGTTLLAARRRPGRS